MKITLNNAGKKFNREWIFRNINAEFHAGNHYAVLGPNGSGKSTFLQTIAGNLSLSEGKINYDPAEINDDNFFKHITICAPYMQLIEELTLTELLQFHIRFKPLMNKLSIAEAINIIKLSHVAGKQLRYYSSGMKQRVKLGMAILSDTSILILDEPLTNLDDKAKQWYYGLIEMYADNRIIFVGSNREDEYNFCKYRLNMIDLKVIIE